MNPKILPLLSPLFLQAGCHSQPTNVVRFSGPSAGIVYTIATWEESGAISSDFTRVSVAFTHEGQTDKQTFLDGPYLHVTDVRWNGPDQAIICLSEGRVNSFRKKVSLHAGAASYTITNTIDYHCSDPLPM